MLGGHLDSWHGGTGATDNAAGRGRDGGVRILKALARQAAPHDPHRALERARSRGCSARGRTSTQHFASRPTADGPKQADQTFGTGSTTSRPLTPKPEHAKLSAYFNLDNGTGQDPRDLLRRTTRPSSRSSRRGSQPFHDLGATTVTMRNTGGTDHESFDASGLPGFQFIQDELDYETRTHHSNQDVYERLQRTT